MVNKITFTRHFIAIRNKWLKDFDENSIHAPDKNYFRAIFNNRVVSAKAEVDKESNVSSKISELHNQLDLDDRVSCLELIKQLCNKEARDLFLTVQQIAEITALDKVWTIVDRKTFSIQNENKIKKSTQGKTITLRPEIIDKLHTGLKIFFDEKEWNRLLILLKGEKIDQKLLFLFNANRLIELFRRLKYNDYIIDNNKNIEAWVLESFNFKSETNGEIKEFKHNTIHSILYGQESAQPKKGKRIIDEEWLPYKSPGQLKKEKENEKLE